jgi:tRNA-uridine 2-sulfurtransferase
MSGGVDSSVAAAMLLEQGYDVIGITLRLWAVEDMDAPRFKRHCCPTEDADDARAVANVLGIPHYLLNMEQEFEDRVIKHFVDEYGRGRTPNPCIACNEHVKFGSLLARAMAFDADYLATGHYARIQQDGDLFRLLTGEDPNKDQSYVLYTLGQSELARLKFPIGEYTKPEIRAMAVRFGLPVADKPDSADICFIPENDNRGFLADHLSVQPGNIVDEMGRVVGQHKGFAGYTIGQRKGLGVALGAPRFITNIDPELNVITVGPEDALLHRTLIAEDVAFTDGHTPHSRFSADVKIRYRTQAAPATVHVDGKQTTVRFDEPQRAITPGQAVVFYDGDEMLGGGTIVTVED